MNKKIDNLKNQAIVLFSVELVILLIMGFALKIHYTNVVTIFVLVNAIFTFWILYLYFTVDNQQRTSIKSLVDANASEAIKYGDVGIVIYDENYVITWMSDMFAQRHINYVNERITDWLPDFNRLFQESEDAIEVVFEERRYRVERRRDDSVLFFKDVTEIHDLQQSYHDESVIIGIIHMDNYADTIQYEDEQKIALINTNLRQAVLDWCNSNEMLVRRIRNDRFLVVMNQKNYEEVAATNFEVMNLIRTEAAKIDVAITLSMAFAGGTSNYLELDEMVNDLLELAQNRGGDQTAIRMAGETTKFIGGSSEAQEKRSRVRVRVMSQTIRNLIENSSNVFIVGHNDIDFDCMSSAIIMNRIVQSAGHSSYIIASGVAIEDKLKQTLYKYNDSLIENNMFISESEALEMVDKDSLVIIVDHHTSDLSCAPQLVHKIKKKLIIDHHRRKIEDNIEATLIYLETSASSATELVVELLAYQPEKIEFNEAEVNIMFAGLLVDTNHFRKRSGSRTFEAAAELRKMGADPYKADDMLKDTYTEFADRTKLLSSTKRIFNDFVIAPIEDDQNYTRTLLSQAADYLLDIQDVQASFVIAKIDDDTTAISARSAGEINVQVIMEQLQGGGHFSAAACQRKNTTVDELVEELTLALQKYQEEHENENNTIS